MRVDDNFFDLGGHSLLAVKMFARIHRAFGRIIPFSVLLQRPTIADLAPLLDPQRTMTESSRSSVVPLRTGGSRPPILFIHGLGAEVWTFVELAKHLDADQVVYGIQPVAGDTTPLSIAAMAERHVAEIRRVVPSGPFAAGWVLFGRNHRVRDPRDNCARAGSTSLSWWSSTTGPKKCPPV